jgi:hypothetical protein
VGVTTRTNNNISEGIKLSYGTKYIDIPELKPERVGRISAKMSNNKTTSAEVSKAPRAKYNKTRGEHYKDIVIAVLIAGIIAFIGGMHFSNEQNGRVSSAVKAAVAPTVSAQAPTSK